MLKNYVIFTTSLFLMMLTALSGSLFLQDQEPKLIINMEDTNALPRNFRKAQTPFLKERSSEVVYLPVRNGLDKMNMSGSSQYSKGALQVILKNVGRGPVYLIDLREESHGFINDHAASWFVERNWKNLGLTPQEIESDQQTRLLEVHHMGKAFVYYDKHEENPNEMLVKNVSSEERLAKNLKVNYKRFYVTDHMRPRDEVVDEFIQFVKSLPDKNWLHFHCKGGKGRTTTFMAMFDMMHNSRSVSFEDIILRQWLIGGIKLDDPEKDAEWKEFYVGERYEFLRNFYKYCREHPQFDISWSEYTHN